MFRSYRAFAPKLYKVVMWFIYPLLAIICCILVQNGCFGLIDKVGFHFMVSATMLANCMIFVEGMGDYWLFSGIQSKYANHMDLLKSSKKGNQFFKNALLADVIRRAFTILVCSLINVGAGVLVHGQKLGGSEGILLLSIYGLCCYFLSTLTVFICRYGDMWYVNLGISYAASFLSLLLNFLLASLKLPLIYWLLIFLIPSIIITIITVRVAMKKVEDSYYDQRN